MQGKHEASLKPYEIAIVRNPGFPQWFLDIGVAYYHNGLLEKAVESYQKALKNNRLFPTKRKNQP